MIYLRIKNIEQIIKVQLSEIRFIPVCQKQVVAFIADRQERFFVPFPAGFVQRLHPQRRIFLNVAERHHIHLIQRPDSGKHQITVLRIRPTVRCKMFFRLFAHHFIFIMIIIACHIEIAFCRLQLVLHKATVPVNFNNFYLCLLLIRRPPAETLYL